MHDLYAETKTSEVLFALGQRLVPVSNKDELLSETRQVVHGEESRARAAAILSRLAELNPEVAREFLPKQDALADVCFRLLCSASLPNLQFTGTRFPSYIAVSYCWHYSGWPLAAAAKPVAAGWEISEPMMQAVMALRQDPEEGVWLDKLCINQNDHENKIAHIGAMDAIYHSARRVAILLEDVQLQKSEEEAGLVYAQFYEDMCREVKDGGLEGAEKGRFVDEYFPRKAQELRDSERGHILAAVKSFAMKMMGARWYSRGWCAHESRMTKHQKVNNPLFMCFGSKNQVLSFEFRFIHFLGLHLSDWEPKEMFHDLQPMKRFNDPEPKNLRQLWFRIQRLMPDVGSVISTMQHIVSVLSFGCSKGGDLISIALNTAGIPLYFAGNDAQSVGKVVWKFTLLVLASGDLAPLVALGSKLRLPGPRGEIISWATHPDQGVIDEPLMNPLPASITAITPEYIELDLLVFESLPKAATAESLAAAASLITEHKLDAIADNLFSALPDNTQYTIDIGISAITNIKATAKPLQTLRHNLLALALDNGLDWTLAFPSVMQQSTTAWLHGTLGTTSDPLLIPAAEAFLALFSKPPSAAPPSSTLGLLTRSLTTLLDPRLFLFTAEARRLPLSPSLGHAVLTPSTSNRAYVAIPAALAHLPGWYDRAWHVEPFDPAGKPEELADLLPREDLRLAKEGEEVLKVEDVVPVLNSDYEDRRAKREDERGTWRLRRRSKVFGGLQVGGGGGERGG
ncbi:hypothetical protein NEMBOFW57_010955 [Staphylotrichum longicolle]|uniref:Heterokaryon incompatibility domain-containing protein n=1 Tax=Staphylotrichum longicolle TaxID=669026 RepID=A0AAD4ENM9_9PEZI|nr:hypothetical protein NEMBOFW57_010955 [Staphylotrichum longicolle]